MPTYTRRRLLASGVAGFAALAGRATAAPQTDRTPSAGPFVIRNQSEDSHVLSLTIRREGKILLDRIYDLAPGGRQEIENPIDERGRYKLAVELGTGAKDSATWALANCERIKHVEIVVSQADTVGIETEQGTVQSTSCG